MSVETWEEMHLNATDGVLVQKSVKVIITFEKNCQRYPVLTVHTRGCLQV